MEKFIINAISVDENLGTAYIIEGDELYYFIRESAEDIEYDSVYPCPVAEVAGRFRDNWFLDNGEHDPVPEELVKRIQVQQREPKFKRFCELQKQQFGSKRILLK